MTGELFKNKYRIESTRLSNWDYSNNGIYFLTICTRDREHMFGKICNSEMILNNYGEIVKLEWERSFEIRKELLCDCYIIMPNHIHAIITVETHGCASHNGDGNASHDYGEFASHNGDGNASKNEISKETHSRASLRTTPTFQTMPVRSKKSISSFVGQFKSNVTRKINECCETPKQKIRQSRFYDHIIRDEKDLNRVREYIATNPFNWGEDQYKN